MSPVEHAQRLPLPAQRRDERHAQVDRRSVALEGETPLVVLVATVAYTWAVLSTKTSQVALRGAVRTSDQEKLTGDLREDLSQALRITPDPAGNGFTLDLAREDGEVDKVRYSLTEAKGGRRLVRTYQPAGGASRERRVATNVEACTGEQVAGKAFRVRVTWAGGAPGSELVVEVARRIGLME